MLNENGTAKHMHGIFMVLLLGDCDVDFKVDEKITEIVPNNFFQEL